jgi:hypothetical protein
VIFNVTSASLTMGRTMSAEVTLGRVTGPPRVRCPTDSENMKPLVDAGGSPQAFG